MEVAIDFGSCMATLAPILDMPRVAARGLSLAFGGQQLFDGANLDVRPGQVVLLRGANGSGKTTLLNMIGGFTAPDRGSIQLSLGSSPIDVRQTTPERLARLGVGRLWQDIRLFPTLSALDNVLAATPSLVGQSPLLALAAYPRVRTQEQRARERALENLDQVGLRHRASSSADMLSAGQMKRVALARLLQMEAKLWLLDEPLSGLDMDSSAALVQDLDRLCRERDLAILVVEHAHERLRPIADAIHVLREGRIEPEETMQ